MVTGLPMIICSCNVLSDYDVRAAASMATCRTTSHVYGCLGCRPHCGRCIRTIRKIIDEVLDVANVGYPVDSVIYFGSEDTQS